MSLEIRRVEQGDVADLHEVLAAADRYRRDHTSHRSTDAWSRSLLEERDIDPLRDVYLARAGGRAVAVLELVDDGAGTLTIAQLIVAEPFRFLGYGRWVTHWVDAFAQERGHTLVALGVASTNRGAVSFWEALGFQRTGRLGKGASSLLLMERAPTEAEQESQAPGRSATPPPR